MPQGQGLLWTSVCNRLFLFYNLIYTLIDLYAAFVMIAAGIKGKAALDKFCPLS